MDKTDDWIRLMTEQKLNTDTVTNWRVLHPPSPPPGADIQ